MVRTKISVLTLFSRRSIMFFSLRTSPHFDIASWSFHSRKIMAESWDCISKPLVIRCPIASDGSGSTFGPLVPLTPLWFCLHLQALSVILQDRLRNLLSHFNHTWRSHILFLGNEQSARMDFYSFLNCTGPFFYYRLHAKHAHLL